MLPITHSIANPNYFPAISMDEKQLPIDNSNFQNIYFSDKKKAFLIQQMLDRQQIDHLLLLNKNNLIFPKPIPYTDDDLPELLERFLNQPISFNKIVTLEILEKTAKKLWDYAGNDSLLIERIDRFLEKVANKNFSFTYTFKNELVKNKKLISKFINLIMYGSESRYVATASRFWLLKNAQAFFTANNIKFTKEWEFLEFQFATELDLKLILIENLFECNESFVQSFAANAPGYNQEEAYFYQILFENLVLKNGKAFPNTVIGDNNFQLDVLFAYKDTHFKTFTFEIHFDIKDYILEKGPLSVIYNPENPCEFYQAIFDLTLGINHVVDISKCNDTIFPRIISLQRQGVYFPQSEGLLATYNKAKDGRRDFSELLTSFYAKHHKTIVDYSLAELLMTFLLIRETENNDEMIKKIWTRMQKVITPSAIRIYALKEFYRLMNANVSLSWIKDVFTCYCLFERECQTVQITQNMHSFLISRFFEFQSQPSHSLTVFLQIPFNIDLIIHNLCDLNLDYLTFIQSYFPISWNNQLVDEVNFCTFNQCKIFKTITDDKLFRLIAQSTVNPTFLCINLIRFYLKDSPGNIHWQFVYSIRHIQNLEINFYRFYFYNKNFTHLVIPYISLKSFYTYVIKFYSHTNQSIHYFVKEYFLHFKQVTFEEKEKELIRENEWLLNVILNLEPNSLFSIISNLYEKKLIDDKQICYWWEKTLLILSFDENYSEQIIVFLERGIQENYIKKIPHPLIRLFFKQCSKNPNFVNSFIDKYLDIFLTFLVDCISDDLLIGKYYQQCIHLSKNTHSLSKYVPLVISYSQYLLNKSFSLKNKFFFDDVKAILEEALQIDIDLVIPLISKLYSQKLLSGKKTKALWNFAAKIILADTEKLQALTNEGLNKNFPVEFLEIITKKISLGKGPSEYKSDETLFSKKNLDKQFWFDLLNNCLSEYLPKLDKEKKEFTKENYKSLVIQYLQFCLKNQKEEEISNFINCDFFHKDKEENLLIFSEFLTETLYCNANNTLLKILENKLISNFLISQPDLYFNFLFHHLHNLNFTKKLDLFIQVIHFQNNLSSPYKTKEIISFIEEVIACFSKLKVVNQSKSLQIINFYLVYFGKFDLCSGIQLFEKVQILKLKFNVEVYNILLKNIENSVSLNSEHSKTVFKLFTHSAFSPEKLQIFEKYLLKLIDLKINREEILRGYHLLIKKLLKFMEESGQEINSRNAFFLSSALTKSIIEYCINPIEPENELYYLIFNKIKFLIIKLTLTQCNHIIEHDLKIRLFDWILQLSLKFNFTELFDSLLIDCLNAINYFNYENVIKIIRFCNGQNPDFLLLDNFPLLIFKQFGFNNKNDSIFTTKTVKNHTPDDLLKTICKNSVNIHSASDKEIAKKLERLLCSLDPNFILTDLWFKVLYTVVRYLCINYPQVIKSETDSNQEEYKKKLIEIFRLFICSLREKKWPSTFIKIVRKDLKNFSNYPLIDDFLDIIQCRCFDGALYSEKYEDYLFGLKTLEAILKNKVLSNSRLIGKNSYLEKMLLRRSFFSKEKNNSNLAELFNLAQKLIINPDYVGLFKIAIQFSTKSLLVAANGFLENFFNEPRLLNKHEIITLSVLFSRFIDHRLFEIVRNWFDNENFIKSFPIFEFTKIHLDLAKKSEAYQDIVALDKIFDSNFITLTESPFFNTFFDSIIRLNLIIGKINKTKPSLLIRTLEFLVYLIFAPHIYQSQQRGMGGQIKHEKLDLNFQITIHKDFIQDKEFNEKIALRITEKFAKKITRQVLDLENLNFLKFNQLDFLQDPEDKIELFLSNVLYVLGLMEEYDSARLTESLVKIVNIFIDQINTDSYLNHQIFVANHFIIRFLQNSSLPKETLEELILKSCFNFKLSSIAFCHTQGIHFKILDKVINSKYHAEWVFFKNASRRQFNADLDPEFVIKHSKILIPLLLQNSIKNLGVILIHLKNYIKDLQKDPVFFKNLLFKIIPLTFENNILFPLFHQKENLKALSSHFFIGFHLLPFVKDSHDNFEIHQLYLNCYLALLDKGTVHDKFKLYETYGELLQVWYSQKIFNFQDVQTDFYAIFVKHLNIYVNYYSKCLTSPSSQIVSKFFEFVELVENDLDFVAIEDLKIHKMQWRKKFENADKMFHSIDLYFEL